MKMHEIMETASAGATAAGSMATVTSSLTGTQSRSGHLLISGKYSNDDTPNTPQEYKRIAHARRRFENSPGH